VSSTPPKTLILLGPPGSGKDTQAFALATHYGYFVLVTGDLFRAEITHKTAVGQKMQEIMDKGGLLPAEMVRGVVEGELERHKSTIEANGLLFDGFPRTADEIQDAEGLIDAFRLRPDLAVLLDVSEEEVLRRLTARGRTDDAPHIAKNRLTVYHKETGPVVEHYRKIEKLLVVDGNPSIEVVTANLQRALEQYHR